MKYLSRQASVGWKNHLFRQQISNKKKQRGDYDCLRFWKLNIGMSSFLSL